MRLLGEAVAVRADASGQQGSQVGAGLRADWAMRDDLSVHATWHQSIDRQGDGPAARDDTYVGAGASLALPNGSASAEAGWGPELGPRLLLGGEQRARDGTTYGTFSFDPDAPSFARETAASVGVRRAEDAGADGLELNFGCPHGMCERGMGSAVGQNPKVIETITGWVMEAAEIPVICVTWTPFTGAASGGSTKV